MYQTPLNLDLSEVASNLATILTIENPQFEILNPIRSGRRGDHQFLFAFIMPHFILPPQ